MALVPQCDRCAALAQVYPLLGKDLCKDCLSDVRALISHPPLPRRADGRAKRNAFRELVFKAIQEQQFVHVDEISRISGENRRKVYFALIHMANRGELLNQGKGRFVALEAQTGSAA